MNSERLGPLAVLGQIIVSILLGGLMGYFLLDAWCQEMALLEARLQELRPPGFSQAMPEMQGPARGHHD